jgi:hypothetical protein
VIKLVPSGGNLVLSWTLPSTFFALQQSTDLSARGWMDVAASPALNPTNLRYEVPVSQTNGYGFFRLASPSVASH